MRSRQSARVIVINPRREVLLLKYEDDEPMDPARPHLLAYWIPPGGGVKHGESFEDAAARELEEETGIQLSSVGPWVWTRELQLTHRGELKRFHERYFVAWEAAPRELRHRTREKIRYARWWSPQAMRDSGDAFLPEGFAKLLEPLVAGQLPSVPRTIHPE